MDKAIENFVNTEKDFLKPQLEELGIARFLERYGLAILINEQARQKKGKK